MSSNTQKNTESSLKITFIVFLILFFSFLLLIGFMHMYTSLFLNGKNDNSIDVENQFYSKQLATYSPDTKKIFLIGSSQVGRLNETLIQEYLFSNNKNYEVYNLAITGDTPKNRLDSVDKIISLKPDLVLYAVGFRDFAQFVPKSDIIGPQSILPDPSQYFHKLISIIGMTIHYDFNKIKSPKVATIGIIERTNISSKNKNNDTDFRPNSPFYSTTKLNSIIFSDSELRRESGNVQFQLGRISTSDNENMISLEDILQKFNNNHIKVILISVPYSKYYLESIPDSDKQNFVFILNGLSSQYGIHTYLLHDKYQYDHIWNGNDHLAFGGKEIIPNDDVAKILLKELNS